MPIDALSVLCAQLTHDLLAIAKFLLYILLSTRDVVGKSNITTCGPFRVKLLKNNIICVNIQYVFHHLISTSEPK